MAIFLTTEAEFELLLEVVIINRSYVTHVCSVMSLGMQSYAIAYAIDDENACKYNEDMTVRSVFLLPSFWYCGRFSAHTNHVCIYISGCILYCHPLFLYCKKYYLHIGNISTEICPNKVTTITKTENLSIFLTAKRPASFSSDINLISNRWHAFLFWNRAKMIIISNNLRKIYKQSYSKNLNLTLIEWVE